MSLNEFQKQYSRLNKQQKRAVDEIEGPVMVMAGPGTGKTQVLACRVANILDKQDVDPQNILALTFTDAAAQNMRERIVKMIGTAGYYVRIMTFHSFASEVISEYPEKFVMNLGSEPLSDYERFQIFEEIFTQTNFNVIKPLNAPLYYIKEVIKKISELKRENISPEKFEQILKAEEEQFRQEKEDLKKSERIKKEKNLEKQQDLLTAYTKYHAALQNKKRFDFDDMILFTVQVFQSDEDVLIDYQEQFQYFLVDEYQDTNAAQNKIVELLASHWVERPNLFVVGDPHQSIYRFQGASTENMLQFINKYPNAEVITLDTGYRCHQSVYSAAHQLISNNELSFSQLAGDLDPQTTQVLDSALFKQLSSPQSGRKDSQSKLEVYEAESEVHELLYISNTIQKLLKRAVPASEIAILYRNNKEAENIRTVLGQHNIPVQRAKGENVFEDLYILQLLELFSVVLNAARGVDAGNLFDVLLYPWIGVESTSVYKVSYLASQLRRNLIDIFQLTYSELERMYLERNEDTPLPLSKAEFEAVQSIWKQMLQWHSLSHSMLFHEWFSLFINKNNSAVDSKLSGFGFMDYLLQENKTDSILAINSLYSQIKGFVASQRTFDLDAFISIISTMQEHNIAMPLESIEANSQKVELSTVHSSKGKEWQYVFCVGVNDKKWGNSRSRELLPLPDSILLNTDISKKEKNEDERRLFYVAITRSSKKTFVSYPRKRLDGKELLGSMFITEITQAVASKHSNATTSEMIRQIEDMLRNDIQSKGESFSQADREFFAYLVSKFKLSVTALNTYLQDPYEFMINSLLRVPRAKSPILSFGTAAHYALEKYNRRLQQPSKNKLSEAEFLEQFMYALENEFLSESDYDERKKYGQEVLSQYYQSVLASDDPRPPLYVEKYFGGRLSSAVLMDGAKEIQLSGRIDKIDLIDKKLRKIRVTDYKTGSPKSRNVIIGKSGVQNYSQRELDLPETIRGRYQRQLVFYKLLTQQDSSFLYEVVEATFDFIEPGGAHKNKHVTHSFKIPDQAVEDLKKLIIEVMREIRDLRFLDLE